MPDVFLSYSREDQATARRYADALTRAGFAVWWDQALHPGEAFDQVTERALEDAKAVVVLWSKSSVNSRWVRAEATQAQAGNRLVPVMIEACKRPIMFELTHTADLSAWQGDDADPAWQTFIASLRRFTGAEFPVQQLPTSIAAAPAARSWNRRSISWIAAAFAALLLIAGMAWYFNGHRAKEHTAGAQASIAVLPFDDMSSGKDEGYFADGVAEEILNQLAGIDPRQLRVIARNSSFVFRGAANLQQVGKALDVEHVLEGSVRRNGDQLRITAQLINTRTNAHLWSKTYNRPLGDLFAVQEEVARSVAQSLQVSLGIGFGQQPGMTRDIVAYDAFLAASIQLNAVNVDAQRRAIDLLEQAVTRDPTFLQAQVALADAYAFMASLSTGRLQEWMLKSKAVRQEVQRQAPNSALANLALAEGAVYASHWKEADRRYKLLAQAGPGDRLGYVGNMSSTLSEALFRLMVGHTDRAIGLLQQQKALDPLNPVIATVASAAYANNGDFSASFAESEQAYVGDPTLGNIIGVIALPNALGARDRKQILRWLDATPVVTGNDTDGLAFGQHIKELLDNPSAALAYLAPLAKDPAASITTLDVYAALIAYFGDAAGAFKIVRSLYERGDVLDGVGVFWSPVMRDARKLPEFHRYVHDIGLVDFWRESGWPDLCHPTAGDDFECD